MSLQKVIRIYWVIGLVAAVFLFATPPSVQAQPAQAGKTVVIKAAWRWDGKSDTGNTPRVVVVSGGKIQAVGANTQIPAGAEVIDLGDATLLSR